MKITFLDARINIMYLMMFIIIGGSSVASSLKKYKEKRDLKVTPEPAGKKRKSSKRPIFVIQEHRARALHYDFRLEIDGVLKSWAVPKGPSLNPRVKRLAIPTEDHPYEYAKFEGVIPKGHYGAGPVMIWDKGTFRNIKEKDGKIVPLEKCFKEGNIEIFLNGKKLKGAFALVKKKMGNNWLLVKMKDEYASARKNPVTSQTKSAKTDRTMAQIIKDEKKKVKK